MADKTKISELPAGLALDGTEIVPVTQGLATIQTTAQEIADLADLTGLLDETAHDALDHTGIIGVPTEYVLPIATDAILGGIKADGSTITIDVLGVATAHSTPPNTTTDITVYGVTQGSYTTGDVIASGTSLETVVKNMLQTIIPPTYVAPSLVISNNTTATVEVGSTITPTITPTYQQRDGGTFGAYAVLKDAVQIYTSATAESFTSGTTYTIGTDAIVFNATATYGQGPIKNDNQGNAYPTGRIEAGTVTSNSISTIGKRKVFYTSIDNLIEVLTSADVRGLESSVLGPVDGTTFTINISTGDEKVVFAYPASLRDVSTVKYVEFGNGEVKDTFTKTTVNVEGLNGYAAVSYKVYTYFPSSSFGDNITYVVTI